MAVGRWWRLILALWAIAPAAGFAAVNTADVRAEVAGGRVAITYRVVGTELARVRLRGLRDGALPLRVRGVLGDVGEGVAPGAGRRLVWPFREDYPQGFEEIDVALEVLAEPVAGAGVLAFPVRAAFGVGFTVPVLDACLAAAAGGGVQVVVAEIDSPGGSSRIAEDATDRLLAWRAAHPRVQLVAYVVGEAAGAAALFACAFDELYMAADASIGGAVPPEDAEVLVGMDLVSPPRFRFHARQWLGARGVPEAAGEELIRQQAPRRFGAQEAVATRIAAALVPDRAALGQRLGYSTWQDRGAGARKIVAERAAVVQRGLAEYDALAAMIDAGLAELERGEPGADRVAAQSVLGLAKELGELQQQFPFVVGLFEKEFPGGVEAVKAACRKAGELAPAGGDGRVASARKTRRRRRRR